MEQQKDSKVSDVIGHEADKPVSDFQYVVLKTEKLTSALHLVTSFLHHTDPIKARLRDQALNTMQTALMLKNAHKGQNFAIIDDLKRNIDNLVSFMSVALTDSNVSQMNLNILQKEYRDLYNYIDRIELRGSELAKIVELSKPDTRALPVHNQPMVVGNIKDTKEHVSVSGVNNERRNQILAFISKHNWSAINEITTAVPGVSSKTIQRELVGLLAEGRLRKKGDRRWSRYAIVEQP